MSKINKVLYIDNIPVEDSVYSTLTDPKFYEAYRMYHDLKHVEYFSSYKNFKRSFEELEFTKLTDSFYKNIISGLLKDMNLRIGSEHSIEYWWQVYRNNTTGHEDHTHFEVPETKGPVCLFSFVHFISVDENDPCFHFLNEDGSEEYVNEKKNDFVLFGSWTRHRVKKSNSLNTRAVIAGNVSLTAHLASSQFFN